MVVVRLMRPFIIIFSFMYRWLSNQHHYLDPSEMIQNSSKISLSLNLSLDTNVNDNARWDPTWFNEPHPGLHGATIGSGNGISAAKNMAKIAACISNGGEINVLKQDKIW